MSNKDKRPKKPKGRQRKVSTRVRDHKMADLAMEGVPYRDIAEQFGLKKSRISEILNKEEIQQYIEGVTSRIISNDLEYSYQNIHHLVKSYKGNEDKAEKEHGFRASMAVLQGAGVLPGAAQSITIANITNTQTNILNPMMQDMIRKHLGLPEPVVVDAETEDIEHI